MGDAVEHDHDKAHSGDDEREVDRGQHGRLAVDNHRLQVFSSPSLSVHSTVLCSCVALTEKDKNHG